MKKLISVVLSIACIMQCGWFTMAKADGFSDISGHWAESAIVKMAEKGYATGNTDGTFTPDASISRAEFFTLIARYMGYEDAEGFTADFKDMDGTEWYAPYVQFVYNKGLIPEGITREKQFKGDKAATREEIAVTFALAYGKSDLVTVETTLFDDHDEISDWAQRPIALAISKGWIRGTDAIHLSPQKTATRAEAISMLSRVIEDVGELSEGNLKSGDYFVGESESGYGVQHTDNYIVNDYTDLSKWSYTVKEGGRAAGCAEAMVSHLQGEGSTPEDGCIYYDIGYSGSGVINALQMKYELHKENAIEIGKTYKCGFKAKLVDNSDEDTTLKINVTKFRDVLDNNIVWSDRTLSALILESDEWLNYEFELTSNDLQQDVVLIWQFGGDVRENIKVYFDDFYWIPIEVASTGDENNSSLKNINTIIADHTNPASVQLTGGGRMDIMDYPALSATTTKESGLLLDYWQDPYRNKISPNSVYTAPARNSYTYRAAFAPYEYSNKGFEVPVSDDILVTTSVPEVNKTTASVNGKITLPEDYKLLDAGSLFYGGYWTENFNLFSKDIKNIPAYAVSESGEFASQVFMNTRYGVLARTYAIIENPDGNVMVQYSDTEYVHSPSRPEKIEHYGIVYSESLGDHAGSASGADTAGKRGDHIDMIALTGADIATVTPGQWKYNLWNSTTDGYWSDIVKYDGAEPMFTHAQYIKDYILAGGDPIQENLDATHRNDMYMFIDLRMNDHHYNNDLQWSTHSWFWKSNPKYWRQDRETTYVWDETPVTGDATERLLNYMNPEVQDYFYGLLEELVSTYDVDGVQMDFDRYYIYFLDEEADMGLGVLTEFVGRVREMVNRISIDRGKDIQVSVRLDDTVEKVNGFGMDVAEWCRRDYVDILNVGDHYTNHLAVDIEGYKALAGNAKVFGELHYLTKQVTVNGSTTDGRRHVTEQVSYATAKNFYDRGADGISLFNFQYVPEPEINIYPKLPLCFDKDALESAEKNYVFTQGKGAWGFGYAEDFDYKFVIGENTDNYSLIIARIEYGQNATNINTEFTLNGTKLKEISRQETELFTPYSSNPSYATRANVKFFEIPLSVLFNGENHFVIDTESTGTTPVWSMHIGFYN